MWHMRSIQARLVLQVSIGLLVLSSLASVLNYRTTYAHEVAAAASLEQQLVRTFETQAEVALFVDNAQMAKGVIEGLGASPRIRAARIQATKAAAPLFCADFAAIDPAATTTSYPLYSPVDAKELLGILTITRNDRLINAAAAEIALRQTVLLLIQILATGTIISLTSRRVISKPVRALARDLASITPGRHQRIQVAAEHAHDEIGSLANSANVLIEAVEAALAEIQAKNALIENQHQLVCETLEQTATLLDNSDEGFLSFGPDLKVKDSYSRECERMLAGPIAGAAIDGLLLPGDPQQRDFLTHALQAVFEDNDAYSRELYLSLLPTEYLIQERWLAARYRILGNGSVMAMLTDCTAERVLQAKVELEQSRLHLVVEAVRQQDSLVEAIADFKAFLDHAGAQILQAGGDGLEPARTHLRLPIHTFKGLFAQFSFYHLPKVLHLLETALSQLDGGADGLALKTLFDGFLPRCQEAFREDMATLEEVLGEEFLRQASSFPITEADLARIEEQIDRLPESEDKLLLKEQVQSLRFKSLGDMLKAYPLYTRELAQRMRKQIAPFAIEGGACKVDPQRFAPFCKSLVHVFRNAVDHGVETPDDRVDAGKAETGHIACRVQLLGHDVVLSISDDGRGMDPQQLLAKAAGAGTVWTGNPYDLVFQDGFSTRKEVTELSGRGIGLAAVRTEVRQLHGRIEVDSVPGSGSTFRFVLPRSAGMNASAPFRRHLIKSVTHWADSYLTETVGLATVRINYQMDGLTTFDLDRPTATLVVTASNRESIVVLSFDHVLIDRLIHFHAGEVPPDTAARNELASDIASELLNIFMGNATEDLQSWDGRVEITPPVGLELPMQMQGKQAALFFEGVVTTECGRLWIRVTEPASQFDQQLNYLKQEGPWRP